MQRDRNFETYQDIELAYEQRPSYFVEPQAAWGEGAVELLELPTLDETNDNIVVTLVRAATAPEIGKPFSYAYRITSLLDLPRLSPNGRAVNTFETHGAGARLLRADDARRAALHRRFRRRRARLFRQ